jgi:nucleoside-diphosphate-sugar epimerase
MLRRAADALQDRRRVTAVSRWSDEDARARLAASGVETVMADLGDPLSLRAIRDAPNVVYMAGQKFGTTSEPWNTWYANTVLPASAAARYAESRIVAFSTGNVYPNVRATGPGSREEDPLTPVGEYANACVGRERLFEHGSRTRGTRVALVRLNYAVDLRYGVLVDIAARVFTGEPVKVGMGWVNVIWQGDANAQAIRCLPFAASPPFVVNVTGPEPLSVRRLAERFGEIFGRPARIEGEEASDALLSDTTRAQSLFGPPSVDTDTLIEWVADWVRRGERLLGRPTKFEVRDGRF